jgi:hypothetical protein
VPTSHPDSLVRPFQVVAFDEAFELLLLLQEVGNRKSSGFEVVARTSQREYV